MPHSSRNLLKDIRSARMSIPSATWEAPPTTPWPRRPPPHRPRRAPRSRSATDLLPSAHRARPAPPDGDRDPPRHVARPDRHDDPRLALAEQQRILPEPAGVGDLDLCADPRPGRDAALGQRDGEPPVRAVVGRL